MLASSTNKAVSALYEAQAPGAVAQPPPSWREEARRDRLVRARIDQDRETGRIQARIAEREAAGRVRQAAAGSRRAIRVQARADRAARRAALAAWAAGHVTDLLFVPVIVVPAVLAWTAMAAYGASLYGPAGRALPAFSEGAMWAFAAAVTISCHRHPERPVWHLRLGTVVFAGFGAALNFAHGLTAYGPVAGVVMALVSVAGVTAHQLVTAGPRRGRADREAARVARAVARRERAARRAAVRRAGVDLDADGVARLVFEPGAAALGRHFGRVRLSAVPGGTKGHDGAPAAVPVPQPEPEPATGRRPSADAEFDRLLEWLTSGGNDVPGVPGAHQEAAAMFAADLSAGRLPGIRAIREGLRVGQDKATQVQAYLRTLASTQ